MVEDHGKIAVGRRLAGAAPREVAKPRRVFVAQDELASVDVDLDQVAAVVGIGPANAAYRRGRRGVSTWKNAE
jgi:hypothetical protein